MMSHFMFSVPDSLTFATNQGQAQKQLWQAVVEGQHGKPGPGSLWESWEDRVHL